VVSISRIDWDKHTNILLEANPLLKFPIQIYGDKNDRYVYQKLRLLDTMNENDLNSCYKGRFPKSQEALMEILKDKQFVIDLSRIQFDGGGSQYTFIEAICNGCVLILNKNWVTSPHSVWKDGENCFVISNSQELIDLLKNINPSQVSKILKNAKKTIAIHTHPQTLALWNFNF
jgi:glycosyltransferase involved in cell wall biosynthesis